MPERPEKANIKGVGICTFKNKNQDHMLNKHVDGPQPDNTFTQYGQHDKKATSDKQRSLPVHKPLEEEVNTNNIYQINLPN